MVTPGCHCNAAQNSRNWRWVQIDIVATRDGHVCPVEVEFTQAVVDAPRNVLDDLAVLIGRYKREKEKLNGLVVALSLPNRRSEYFQVIEDIANVLGIKIGSVTIGALLLLSWNRKTLGKDATDLPFAAAASPSVRKSVERLLGRPARLTLGCASVLETLK